MPTRSTLLTGFRRLATLVAVALLACGQPAAARCLKNVAAGSPTIHLTRADSLAQQRIVSAATLTFVGHASFLIETPQGVRVVTDYNGLNGYGLKPDIVTMNNAHGTHYTDTVEPGVTHVLRGWAAETGDRVHNIELRDLKVWNVPTNARDDGATRFNGNSIFAFQIGDLCLAHLGHLHHKLTPARLEDLGRIDVLMVPIDGAYTMGQGLIADVVKQIEPRIVLPMHYWGRHMLDRFLGHLGDSHDVVWPTSRTMDLTKAGLPVHPLVNVIAGPGGD